MASDPTDIPTDIPTDVGVLGLSAESVARWISAQRWYASKSRSIAELDLTEAIEISAEPPLALLMARASFDDHASDLYQLPLSLLAPDDVGDRPVVAPAGDRVAVDAVADPELARVLLRAMDAGQAVDTPDGQLRFAMAEPRPEALPLEAPARPMGVEQSNSSIVFGDETVLKVFRRLEPGINPELEMLRFLTPRGFPNIAPLHGWYEIAGPSESTTLGVAQRFLGDATGGWELALEQIRADPSAILDELGALGEAIAELHNVLASDDEDPAFAPETLDAGALERLRDDVQAQIERIFDRLPDDTRVAPIAGRGRELSERLGERSRIATGGRSIRTHGDLHLGQTLYRANGWVIIDFEGEPARSLAERRRKYSPLRDVAGMLRSFAYAAAATAILHDHPAPDDFEDRAREVFLERYLATVGPSLLPEGEAATRDLLAILELEKAIYELGYELDNRPDWLPIPVAGIARLLETE